MVSQLMLLNKLLQEKDMSIVTSFNLTSDLFFNYKEEFKFIKNHYEQYKSVPDQLTFLNSFPAFSILEVNEPVNYLVDAVIKDYKDSYMATSFNKIKEYLKNGNSEAAFNLFQSAPSNMISCSSLTCTDLLEDTSRYDHYLDRTVNHDKYYLSTGFNELDKVIGGIDRENENMVIMARPGIGKTQILLKIAAAAASRGLRVGIFEGEMTPDKVGYRIDTFIGHISNTDLNRGLLFSQKEYERYIKSLANNKYGPIKILTQNDVPSGEVTVDVLRAFVEQQKLDILFIDQYDLMEDKHKTNVEHEHVAYIAKDIKKLQVEKQIPIISVCQMTRSKLEDKDGNKVQDTSQAAGSDKISRYATIMIALEQKKDEDTQKTELTLNIVKARDGGNGKLSYFVDFNKGYFTYIPNSKDGITSEETCDDIANSYKVIEPEE